MRNSDIYSYCSFFVFFSENNTFPFITAIHQNVFNTIFLILLLIILIGLGVFYLRLGKLAVLLDNVEQQAKPPTARVELMATEATSISKTEAIEEELPWFTIFKTKIDVASIIYLKAEGNGVKVVGEYGQVWLWKRLKDCEQVFPPQFIKVHRSYIVNLDYLKELKEGNIRLKNGKLISVGNTRLSEVIAKVNAYTHQ